MGVKYDIGELQGSVNRLWDAIRHVHDFCPICHSPVARVDTVTFKGDALCTRPDRTVHLCTHWECGSSSRFDEETGSTIIHAKCLVVEPPEDEDVDVQFK